MWDLEEPVSMALLFLFVLLLFVLPLHAISRLVITFLKLIVLLLLFVLPRRVISVLPRHVISRLVSTLLKLMTTSSALESVRSRRMLIRVLRLVPLRQFYRSQARMRRLLARPFALNLYAADPASFIGKTTSEITRLLRADPVSYYRERDHEDVEWSRGGQRVECNAYRVCTHCNFYVKSEHGQWVLVAKAQKVDLQ
jgi:hypothetical protein